MDFALLFCFHLFSLLPELSRGCRVSKTSNGGVEGQQSGKAGKTASPSSGSHSVPHQVYLLTYVLIPSIMPGIRFRVNKNC